MAVGIVVPLPAYTLDPAFIAKKAEEVGFESIWYHEHPVLPVDSASPFPATGGAIPWTYRHAGAVRVSVWATHCETEQAMGEQLERMADALVR